MVEKVFMAGAATVAALFVLVSISSVWPLIAKGKVGFRGGYRGMKLPRGLKNPSKGGFTPKMTRWEAAQIVGLK